jgi:fumarylacetoacetase
MSKTTIDSTVVDSTIVDPSTDPALRSWVTTANAPLCDFSIQNLPFGVFCVGAAAPRVGVAIGDQILDLGVLAAAGLLECDATVFAKPHLNDLIALGPPTWRRLRQQISALLAADTRTLQHEPLLKAQVLVPQQQARMLLPVRIGGYTDFYSSREHATNVGSLFRDPANALLPNWSEMPIGYNGRASSVVVSGTPVRRPSGQIKLAEHQRPIFAASRKLDLELETGFIIGVPNDLGTPIACADAEQHIFGMVLLNDWSARDLQAWEYVPLGPFNAKSFATTISPWVVTLAALEPFRTMQPTQTPLPLPYLQQHGAHAFAIALQAAITPSGSAQPSVICRTDFAGLYWSMAQQLAHHTASGCNTCIGDLMGSGTISGAAATALGSLLEMTANGRTPITLGDGVPRTFLEDGDTVSLRGWCQGEGYRVGFGDCTGVVLAGKTT